MKEQERHAWRVIWSLALIQFCLLGPTFGTLGYFYTPWIKEFRWTHADVAVTTTAFLFAQALVSPLFGWLIDRIPAQIVMAIAAGTVGIGYLWASTIHSFPNIVAAFTLIGVGVCASTYVPAMMVAAGWIKNRRGLALGIVMAGASLGGTVLPPVFEYIIVRHGWRLATVCLTIPIWFVALPTILAMVRTHEATGSGAGSVREDADELSGPELGPALLSSPFWMLVVTEFAYNAGYQGFLHHLMTYYIGAGFSPERGAIMVGLLAFFAMVGAITLGSFADLLGLRPVLIGALMGLAGGIAIVLGATSRSSGSFYAVVSMLAAGLSVGATGALLPAILAETLGLRCYGTLWGIILFLGWIGGGLGPFLAGRIFDLTESYTLAFELCAACILVGACTAAMIRPAESVLVSPQTPIQLLNRE